MTLFDASHQHDQQADAARTPLPRRSLIGYGALAVSMLSLFALSLLPSNAVIEMPGPVFDTLGTAPSADGSTQIPLIDVDADDAYATSGSLMMTTVSVRGNREHRPTWLELAAAWFQPSQAVMPLDLLFPPDVTDDERQEQDARDMLDSQTMAKTAAASELGYTYVEVAADPESGTPADGVLREGDRVLAIDGVKMRTADEMIEATTASKGQPMQLRISRDGAERTVQLQAALTQDEQGADVWRIGVSITNVGELPVPVDLEIDNVGGPSAGMMFALGIIDKLTPGELTGGHAIAGTGTIDQNGNVGPIGGIRHKMFGARDAGAEFFLAPASNCAEVAGHVPDGLTVVRTATLSESLQALDAISSGEGIDALPTCAAQ